MAWTAEKVKAMRESVPSKTEKSSGWTAAKVRAVRASVPTNNKAAELTRNNTYNKALQQYTERHASDIGEVDARNDTVETVRPAGKPLSQSLTASTAPSEGKALTPQSAAPTAPLSGEPLSGKVNNALDMGKKWGAAVQPNVLEDVGGGAMAYGSGPAQALKASYAPYSTPDEFDRLNQWMDTGDNKNLAEAVRRVDEAGIYSDADLIKAGWTQEQVDTARQMNAAMDAVPGWKKVTRRASNTIGGTADVVASAPLLGAEYGAQTVKNIAATKKNLEKMKQEVEGDEHARSLYDLLTSVDSNGSPKWPKERNRELISMGYNSKEIQEMRDRLAGLEVTDGIDKNKSVGYQLYDRGQQLLGAAQSGLSPMQKAVSGVATSAAENLAVAAVNPAAVLPVLSAQGAADAMGQSAAKGESAGKALGGGLAKFGAGWAINSVGAADLAKTMGSDYAKDTLAGQIADWVQGIAGSSEFAMAHPAVAAAVSGGIDNAMQAFVETYADKAIDAALGDSEAAQSLFTKDTFVSALESGLSGGASGAMGGAVGSGLARLNGGNASWRGQVEAAADSGGSREELLGQRPAGHEQSEMTAGSRNPKVEAAADSARGETPQSAAPTAPLSGEPLSRPGKSELDTESATAHEAPEGGTAAGATQAAETVRPEETLPDDLAVRQFAEAVADDSLTGKTIRLFVPEAGNQDNRAAFEQTYGVELPDTAAATRRMLRDIAARENAEATVKAEAPAVDAAEATGQQERAESKPGGSAMPDTADEMGSANAPLRETVGLKDRMPMSRKQAEVRRALEGWKVTDKAADTISKNMPEDVDTEIYAAAASPLYRLGRAGAESFEQALELAGSTSGTAADINYIMGTDTGKTALKIAYLQGKGEAMLYAEKMAELGGALSDKSTSGNGRVLYKGTMRDTDGAAGQIISLNAAATGTDAVLKDVLNNDRNVKAYVDSETAKIYFGDSAEDVFGTVLHEDWHWYNALDAEGARTLQEHALEYLARNSGYENIDELIRSKVKDYGAQGLTYEQAAEELVADAWRGIFDSEESFKRWVEFQRGQAEKNAGKADTIRRVMEKVRQMLDGLISKAKEVLSIDPDNRAAQKAKRLAEAEKRTLQDEYFAHAEKAMDTLRAAKENAAALRTESAAEKQGVRYSIDENFEKAIDELDEESTKRYAIRVGATSKVLKSIGVKDRDIFWQAGKLRKILNKHSEANHNAVTGEGSVMTKEILKQVPQVLENPIIVLHSDTTRNADYASRIFMYGDVKDTAGKPVNVSLELLPTDRNGLAVDNIVVLSAYGHEGYRAGRVIQGEILYTDPDTKRTTAWLRGNRLRLPFSPTNGGAKATLHYFEGNVKAVSAQPLPGQRLYYLQAVTEAEAQKLYPTAQTTRENKENNAPVKKTVRTQLTERAEQADRDAKRDPQRQASRVLAEKAAAFDTLNQFFGLTRNTRLSDGALESLAIRWTKINGSKADRMKLANETRALAEYLRSEGADMAKAQSLAETLAGEVLDGATYRDAELWNEHPDLHDLTYTVDRDGKAKAELVKRYGSWSEAVAEARRHGVKLRQEEGYRDGNPAEQYEAVVNDTRAVGGVREGAAALFRSAAQRAGVAGAASMESTEWLDVLMNVHDAIKPKMMSRFADVAEYEDAKVELAGRMIGDILSHPEMTDAEAVFEGILKHNRDVAAMAAGEERAAEAVKSLKPVQQTQRKSFADRMRENSHSGQSAEARDVSRAEKQLDANLEMLGAQVSTAAGLDEKLTALREAYEREWKAEKKRMKEARQEMLDEIKLERQQHKREVYDLSRQVAGEQKRADRAERQLMFQENDILEWEQENQRKAEAWQQKQAQRNAIAIETARQQRDEDVAVAKALAEKRVQKVREGRQKDELKRSIRSNSARLNQMALRPNPGKYIPKGLVMQAAEVAKLADMTILNNTAVNKLTALQDSIRRSGDTDVGLHADWENSGVEKLITALRDDMNASKQTQLDRLNKQLTEAEALEYSDKAEQLKARLRQRIRETENRTYLPMTVDQLRMLKAITASTLHIIRTENKTVSLAKAEEVDGMAMKAAHEVQNTGGNGLGSRFEVLKDAANRYQLDMMSGVRLFRRLGGYTKNGQMEQLGRMLNDGQRKQTEILVKGEALFENVTGKAHLKEVEKFAGPGAELVDIGLKDSKGNAVPLNHAQLCSLYMHLRNEDSRNHLLTGGLTLPDAARYAKGDIERAYQDSKTVTLGTLMNEDGTPMADSILKTVQEAMTDYDRAWCADMENFFGTYTTNLINETSMKLLGYDRATVKNYYPIAVDRSTLATEIEGLKHDATIEGRGFLKERLKSDKPILLEECQNVVKRSLRDTAAYAGLAAPIRDVQRVLNSTVETAEGIGILKDKVIRDKWGRETVDYINDLLTDLQSSRRKRSSTVSRALDRMRGNYAGAILTVNPGVAIAQAASLPTAGAVLGTDTMAAVLPFVKNISAKQRAALEAEIKEHGDSLLQYRLRGTQQGELASIGTHRSLVSRASEAMPALIGWISGMDEVTVAALWEGAKRYVEHHAGEFAEGAAEKGSDAYWEAVNQMYQRVIEETQPNYTTMQRSGIQRSDHEMVKTLTMFTTQRFQNYNILADAVGDYSAQKARYKADQSAENRAEVERAGKSLQRAVVSQVAQTAVFALLKIGADFLLHRWDREQDENGDVTLASMAKRFFDLYGESFAGNFLYGSEIYNIIGNAVNGTDYDVVSATNISAVNDFLSTGNKLVKLLNKDTSGMSEEELTTHHQKLHKAELDLIQYGLELYGVPAANIRKVMQAFEGYYEDALALARGEGFSFDSVPDSATGQYDRLYNAIQSEDKEEAAAAIEKLELMHKKGKLKEIKINSELTRRLKAYDEDILTAAKARNAGKKKDDETARRAVLSRLYHALGVEATGKKDEARRTELISVVNKAASDKADELLKVEKGLDKDDSVYADLMDEAANGRVKDIQTEVNRLLKAGKDKGDIKTKITGAVKNEYLAGSDGDRARLEKKLTALTDADGEALYEDKDFTRWVNEADKAAEKAKNEKNWWDGVK